MPHGGRTRFAHARRTASSAPSSILPAAKPRAASSLGMAHPLLVIASSLFFGLCQGIGLALQNVVKAQLTNTLPYIATIVALVIFSKRNSSAKLKK